jgi:hypothetical protein
MGREGGVRELMSVTSFQKEYGTTGKWSRKAGGETTQVQTQALKRLYRAHCEGGKVLAGNAGADKWTSKERCLIKLPAHWGVARKEAPLVTWADRGGRVANVEQGPAGAWPGDRSSGRTERVKWEQASTREETRLLNTGDFTAANHYTKDGTSNHLRAAF